MEEEKKEEPRRKKEGQCEDDDQEEEDKDSWKKQFRPPLATVNPSNNGKPKEGDGEQEGEQDGEETDETSSTTLGTAVDSASSSVPDLAVAATPSWSSVASSSPLTLSSSSVVYSHSQRPPLKRRPVASISKPSSSSSSTALSSKNTNNNLLRQQRQDVRQQVTMVVVLMASSTALVIWTLLPVASIMAILIWMASLTVTLQVAYRALLLEYQSMLQQDGLRPYLPASVYQQLTQTSLHQYMTDPSFGLEYRHMLLYFLPLSRDQLEYYLQRLAPRHQYVLQRPGLGFLFGDDWMRHVVGEPAFQQLLQQQQQQQSQGVVPPPILTPAPSQQQPQQQQGTHPRQLLLQDGIGDGGGTSVSSNQSMDIHRVMDGHDDDDEDDDASDLGMEITDSDLPGGTMNEQQALGMARWLGLLSPEPQQRAVPVEASAPTATATSTTRAPATPNPPNLSLDSQLPTQPPSPSPLQQDPEIQQEGQVIYDAFYSLFTDYSNIAYQSVGQVVVDMVDATTPSVIQSSLGLSVVSASVILLGWWQGVYQFQRRSTTAPSSSSSIQDGSASWTMTTRTNNTSATTGWFPSPWFVTSTGLLGGALAGTVALFRFSIRQAFLPTPASSKATGDDSSKDQKPTASPP